MTDTEAWIDGKSVGPKHQGAFYEFRYDVTALLRFGARQQLEVLVSKESSNESVNEAERHSDFWIFGGIYRPVYLEAHPPESVERVAIDARHDGAFTDGRPPESPLRPGSRDRADRDGRTASPPARPSPPRSPPAPTA